MADRSETAKKFVKIEQVQSAMCEKISNNKAPECKDLFADESIEIFDLTFSIKEVNEVSKINTKLFMEPSYKAKLVSFLL